MQTLSDKIAALVDSFPELFFGVLPNLRCFCLADCQTYSWTQARRNFKTIGSIQRPIVRRTQQVISTDGQANVWSRVHCHTIEGGRHDPDHQEAMTLQDDRSPDGGCIAAEAASPEIKAEDGGHAVLVWIIFLSKHAAKQCRNC